MENINNCPVCESSNLENYCQAKDRHYGNKGTFNLDQCLDCQLIFLNPMFNDDELTKFYPEESYYAYQAKYSIPKKKQPRFRDKIRKTLFGYSQKEVEIPGKILDIGCGSGWFLYQYRAKGWTVAGVEPSKAAAKIGNDEGLNIFNGTLLEANFKDDEFDFIHSNHSFEHIYNPNEVLNEIYRILKPNGKIQIGVPNFRGINSRLAKDYWYYLGAPVHTFNYSPNNLKRLLEKHNFNVQEINYASNAHGILGSLQIYANRNNGKTSHEGFISNSAFLRRIATYLAQLENYMNIGDCIEVVATKVK